MNDTQLPATLRRRPRNAVVQNQLDEIEEMEENDEFYYNEL